MNRIRIAIMGAGNSGQTMAADMALRGVEVNLYEMPSFGDRLDPILRWGGIEIIGAAQKGFAELHNVTTDIREALDGVSHIHVSTQAVGHRPIAELCAPYLENGQVIVVQPGNGGALVFTKVFKEKGVGRKDVLIAETRAFGYGCRIIGPAQVAVYAFHEGGQRLIAALPSKNTDRVIDILGDGYPYTWVPAANVLETTLLNPNVDAHTSCTLLNIGHIEYAKGEFCMEEEGWSPSVLRVRAALNREVMALLEVLGIDTTQRKAYEERLIKWIEEGGHYAEESPVKEPRSSKSRYITEDVPIGMVLAASLGDMLGVAMPTYKSMIHLASVINETDYWGQGRTVEKLGIAGMNVEELNAFLTG